MAALQSGFEIHKNSGFEIHATALDSWVTFAQL